MPLGIPLFFMFSIGKDVMSLPLLSFISLFSKFSSTTSQQKMKDLELFLK